VLDFDGRVGLDGENEMSEAAVGLLSMGKEVNGDNGCSNGVVGRGGNGDR
jgi:hypothetical protein